MMLKYEETEDNGKPRYDKARTTSGNFETQDIHIPKRGYDSLYFHNHPHS